MIDLSKPLQMYFVNNPNKKFPYVLDKATPSGKYFFVGSGAKYRKCCIDGRVEGTNDWRIENAKELPVTKSMVAVLYKWGEDIGLINFLDVEAAIQFFKGNPGKILGYKAITVSENDKVTIDR